MSLIFSNLVVIKTLSSNHRMYNLYAKFVKILEIYNAPPKTDRFGAQDSNQKTLCRHGQQLKKTTWSGVQGQGGS